MSWIRRGVNPPPQFTPRDEECEWLSRTEKELTEIQSDLHGITEGLEVWGTSKKIADVVALSELDAELSKIPYKRKSVFLEAQRKCPDLVGDAEKSAFLWTEDLNAKLAAQRLVAYWEHKKKLFGAEKCFLPITLRGALKDDIIALSQGFMRLLPVTDERGRAIIFIDPSNHNPSMYSAASMLRASWYVLSVASKDPELGIVLLATGRTFHCFQHFDYELFSGIVELEKCYLPVRTKSCHHCYPSMFFHITSPITKYFLGGRLRGRFNVHFGKSKDVLQKLDSFGIPRNKVPVELGGEVKLDHWKWLSDRLKQEEGTNNLRNLAIHGVRPSDTQRGSSVAENTPQPHLSGSANDTRMFPTPTKIPSSALMNDPSPVDLASNQAKPEPEEKISEENEKVADTALMQSDKNKGDPRMNCALEAKLKNPKMSLLDALLLGGFEFSDLGKTGHNSMNIFDAQNISLYQRKNQLNRRIRKERKRQKTDAPESTVEDSKDSEAHSVSESDLADRSEMPEQSLSLKTTMEKQRPLNCVSIGQGAPNHALNSHLSLSAVERGTPCVILSNGADFQNGKNNPMIRRDSFYDLITELPGLGDLEGDDLFCGKDGNECPVDI